VAVNLPGIGESSSETRYATPEAKTWLLRAGWISGFTDGEGCFSINIIRQPHRRGRRGYHTGFQVAHEFAVAQSARSIETLRLFESFFGVGAIYINKRYDNHHSHMYRYCVRRRSDLLGTIIPFFLKHPLRSAKQADFDKFAECVRLTHLGVHLSRRGLIKILRIAETMNHCKSRMHLIQELEQLIV
jgi:hypothetical protein